MIKKILACFVILSMIFINYPSKVYAENEEYETYTLTHQGIIQEGKLDLVTYNLDSNLEAYLISNLKAEQPKIDLSAYDISISDIDAIIQELLNNNPNFYNVSFNQCDYIDQKVTTLYPVYTISKVRTNNTYESEVNKILSKITNTMTDLEKILYIHDWLVLNVEYDFLTYTTGQVSSNEVFTAYGAIVNRSAVCQGYAEAFKDLMNRLGIECILVTSNNLFHAWNQVKVGGNWYFVDTTWDDPVPDLVGRVIHDNLLVSKEKCIENGHTYGDWSYHHATSSKYDNYFWTQTEQYIENINGYSYVAFDDSNSNVSISKVNINTQSKSEILSFEERWYDISGDFWWGSTYTRCVVYNNRIFYNTSMQVRSVNFDGSDDRLEMPVYPADCYLVGVGVFDNKLYFAISDFYAGLWLEVTQFYTPVESIEISPVKTLQVGHTTNLNVFIKPENHTDDGIIIGSSDPSIADVDGYGKVTAYKTGTVTIFIEASNGVIGFCEIEVIEATNILGDVNGDNIIDYNDAVMLLQFDSGLINLTSTERKLGDVNKDGLVNYNDAVQILKYDAGLITDF